MAGEDLSVAGHTVPASELQWRTGPSGGPGGQHANRAHSRAEVRFDVAATESLPAWLRDRLLERLASRAPAGVVTVVVDESRSQFRNRAIARRRLEDLLVEASKVPEKRRPTRPTRSSVRRRVDDKRARSDVKRLRRRPDTD